MGTNRCAIGRKKLKATLLRVTAILCCAFMLCNTPLQAETPAEKYERLQGELAGIAKEIEESKDAKDEAEAQRAALEKEQQILDEMIALKQHSLEDTRKALDDKKEQLAQKTAAIQENEALLRERLVVMYKMSDANMLGMVLSVNSFGELMQVVDMMRRVTKSDTDLIQALSIQQEELAQEQEELNKLVAKLNGDYKEMQGDISVLNDNISAQSKQIDYLNANIQQNQQDYSFTEEEAQRAHDDMIALTESLNNMGSSKGEGIPGDEPTPEPAPEPSPDPSGEGDGQEPEPEPEPETPPPPAGTGVYLWPLPGYSMITTYFGETDPAGYPHLGIDIAAPEGASIVAAGDGYVLQAGWSDSYGNFVYIDHGDGLHTLYAHASRLYAGAGTRVSAGDAIAAVGDTGFSFGDHLHFEVYVDGVRQDPFGFMR